jgi:sulfur-oxidizing protein SoxY
MKRRNFLKGTFATSMVGVAVSAGMLSPKAVLAAWPETSFAQKKLGDAITSLLGTSNTSPSGAIKIKAPDIAENGAVVPVTISTTMSNVKTITLLVSKNPQPLCSNFELADNAEPFVSTRIKMGKTSDVVAVVKSGGKLFSANKTVKVTIGGCGG